MATRTFSIKFLGEVTDFQKKAAAAKTSLETVQKAASSPGLVNAMASVVRIGDQLQTAGAKLSGVGAAITSKVTTPAIAAAGALGGIALAGGWKRLTSLDTATRQIEAMKLEGVDAAKVINEDVMKAVEGTAFSLADAAQQAGGFLASQVAPGKDLARVLSLTADAATRANIDFGSMGSMMQRVQGEGKLSGEVMAQMAENGLFVLPMLQKEYGKTQEELRKMVSSGEISSAEFFTVLEKNIGGAAKASGDSIEGMIANTKTAFANLGATALKEVFPKIQEAIGGLQKAFKSDEFKAGAKIIGSALADGFGRAVDAVKGLVDWWGRLSPGMKSTVAGFAAAAAAVGPFLMGAGKVVGIIGTLVGVVPKVIIGIRGAAGAFRVLGAAMSATPIGAIITGITLLVSGLVWFFTQTDIGREIWAKAWDAIKAAAAAVVDWWQKNAAPAFAKAWEVIKAAGAAVVDWWQNTAAPAIGKAWEVIQQVAADVAAWYMEHVAPVFEAIGDLIQAVFTNVVAPAVGAFIDHLRVVAETLIWLWETGAQPVFKWIGEKWAALWAGIQAVWDVVGPPLMEVLSGAWENLKTVVSTIWDGIKIHIETVLGVIRGIIDAITAVIKGDWKGAWEAMQRVNKTIIDGIRRQVENVIGGIRDWLGNTWNTIKTVASTAWGAVRDTIMGVVDPLVKRIQDGFGAARDGIGRALDGVKALAAKPINFVINTVWNDGLRAALNLIPGVNLAKAKPIPGYKKGGFTGWGSPDEISGVTHGREYVLPAKHVTAMGGPKGVEAWRDAAIGGPGVTKPVSASSLGWNGGRYRDGRWHGGLDFPTPVGTPVYSAWPGRVGKVAWLTTSYGRHIRVDHGGGLQTLYAHLSSILTRAGATVAGGQQIGRSGNTGNSRGPHLHFEVRRNGVQVNPTPYLAGGARGTGTISGSGTAPDQGIDLFGLPDKFKAIVSGIGKNMVGPWGELFKGGVLGAVDSAKKWVLDKLGIPAFAQGVRSAPRGLWWAGENGPELVLGRGGETVVPHRQSIDLASQIVGRSTARAADGPDWEAFADRLAERLAEVLDQRGPAAVVLNEGDVTRRIRAEVRHSVKGRV